MLFNFIQTNFLSNQSLFINSKSIIIIIIIFQLLLLLKSNFLDCFDHLNHLSSITFVCFVCLIERKSIENQSINQKNTQIKFKDHFSNNLNTILIVGCVLFQLFSYLIFYCFFFVSTLIVNSQPNSTKSNEFFHFY
jgi:hypothetical protein